MSAFDTTISNGPSRNRVDIAFAGDGYRSSEIATTYPNHVRALTDYMFSGDLLSEPFGRYKNFFNVHRVNVVSAESGADDPSTNTFRNTALDASYLWDGVTQRLLYVSDSKTDAAIASALSGTEINAEMAFVTVNDTQYGGGGGKYAVYAGGNQSSLEIALHEVGHSFAALADEYDYGGPTTYSGGEPIQPNVTTDPTGAKWAHWLGYEQPGVGTIGVYEGGLYSKFGIYRPSVNSKMNSLGQPFDAVSREQFILRIYDYVDPIDAHTDNSARLVNRDSVFVDVIDPAVIKVRWSVDGRTIQDGGVYAFDLSDQGYGLGTFAVTALAYDDTGWVRTGLGKLQQTVTWTIEVPSEASTCPIIARDGTQDGSASTDDTLTGPAYHNTFFVAEEGVSGHDRITNFGKDDVFATSKALFDSNGDGIITFGTNKVLDLDGPDAGIDTVKFDGLDAKKGLRFLGEGCDDVFVYADATVRPLKALEGKLGDDSLTGDNPDAKANKFFFDTALDLNLGHDTIFNFGARDILATTTKQFDSNNDGKIDFGSNDLLDLSGGLGGPGDPGLPGEVGDIAIKNTTGNTITTLEFDGQVDHGGVHYYVYSTVGSAAGTGDLLFA
ncbi:MAG: hypothetical protein EOR81_12285 [Mesorhizobium sp.]|nr:MAG: hypothetical protein EOR81_12285 [Mesorhizobium sp.]